jgi:hypothetical protein
LASVRPFLLSNRASLLGHQDHSVRDLAFLSVYRAKTLGLTREFARNASY